MIFANISIGRRIALSIILPMMAVLWFATSAILTERGRVMAAASLVEMSDIAVALSNAVHELQKERGTTNGFLGSKGAKFGEQLVAQRGLTDGAVGALRDRLKVVDRARFDGGIIQALDSAVTALNDLPARRGKVDHFTITPAEAIAAYSQDIARSLEIVPQMAAFSSDNEMASLITAYASYMQAKERAGQERALGSAGFAAGHFEIPQFNRFLAVGTEQAVYLKQFATFAPAALRTMADQTVSGTVVEDVAKLRKIVVDSQVSGDLQAVDAAYWFKVTTDRINLLKTVEDQIAASLRDQAGALQRSAERSFWLTLLFLVALMVGLGGIGRTITRSITVPLADLTGLMGRYAEGRKDETVPDTERGDEIGAMARSVDVFRTSLIRADQLTHERELSIERQAEHGRRLDQLIHGFDQQVQNIVADLIQAAQTMDGSAHALTQIADSTSVQSSTVAAAAEQASANVQTVASAAEELSASIHEISRQVVQSNQISLEAVEETKRTDAEVVSLLQAADRISDVVSLINDIASQTNLLALNATIEAARAGEAGKGFAVVANEVKNLANQTARATQDITEQVNAVQSATRDAVQAIRHIGQVIGRVNEIAGAIAAAVEQQGAATQEIARNVQEASTGARDVTVHIATVDQSAGETGRSARALQDLAGQVKQQAEGARGLVAGFLRDVRAH